jgi:uncharacterized RDD family membrane protein YckC
VIPDAGDNPYRAPQAAIAASDALEGVHYAGFWRRALAWVIDFIVRQFAAMLLQLAIFGALAPGVGFFGEPGLAASHLELAAAYYLLAIIVDMAYFAGCWHELQGSLGHLAVGARVRDAQGRGDLSWLQCVVRYFACLVSWLPFGLGFVWAGIDERKQGWHDKIASTVVVRA